MPAYTRAPIVEAVLEVKFLEPLPEKKLTKAHKKFVSLYAASETMREYKVETKIDARPTGNPPQVSIDEALSGYRLRSENGLEVAVMTTKAFAVTQLSPYVGWESFFDRFQTQWAIWKSVSGYRNIQRLGVRFVNRLDIPFEQGNETRIEDYLTVNPRLPDDQMRINGYAMQLQVPLPEFKSLVMTLNSGTTKAPLINHLSLLLDIDIGNEKPPQNDEDLSAAFNEMRTAKNLMFERFITDTTRDLIR